MVFIFETFHRHNNAVFEERAVPLALAVIQILVAVLECAM